LHTTDSGDRINQSKLNMESPKMKQTQKYCPSCKRYVLATHATTNEGDGCLHLIVFIILASIASAILPALGGLVVIGYLVLFFLEPPYRCTRCGSKCPSNKAPHDEPTHKRSKKKKEKIKPNQPSQQ